MSVTKSGKNIFRGFMVTLKNIFLSLSAKFYGEVMSHNSPMNNFYKTIFHKRILDINTFKTLPKT